MAFKITAFEKEFLAEVQHFTDRWIGENYFSQDQLEEVIQLSSTKDLNASFLAFDNNELVGVRLSFLPGRWIEKARGISPDLWPCPYDQVGYFKSLFIADSAQKLGLGRSLSQKSMDVLKSAGARAIVCHSWLESPEDSSRRYLESLGFSQLALHPKFWEPVDYLCTRCAPSTCQCTAAEMLKEI